MKPVVVAKILQEALRASWNSSSAHWLHHPMNVKNLNLIFKWSLSFTSDDITLSYFTSDDMTFAVTSS